MSSHVHWCWLCPVCERVYLKYEIRTRVVIPVESSADPLKEFEART